MFAATHCLPKVQTQIDKEGVTVKEFITVCLIKNKYPYTGKYEFISKMRCYIESGDVLLNEWINLIFGVNQAKQESELINRMVQRGNDQYIGSDVLMNEAEYKRQLLGTPYPK